MRRQAPFMRLCVPQAPSLILRQSRRQCPKLTGGSLPAVASTSALRAQGWLLAWEPSPSTSATTSFPHLLPIPALPIPRPASQLPRAKPQPPTQVPSERPHPPAQTAFQHVMFSQTPCSGVAGWLQCPCCPRTAGRLVGVRSAGEGVFQECRWWPHQRVLDYTM